MDRFYCFHRSARGYGHVRDGKPCQDFSALYQDPNRAIITCCDGHGGAIYVRSDIGSGFASKAIVSVFGELTSAWLRKYAEEELAQQIKLQILCEYNKYVERDLAKRRLTRTELRGLDEEVREKLILNPRKAYGTTLSGAMVLGDKLIVAAIGDSETIGVRQGEIVQVFDTENDPVGNVTYSMCQEDAFEHIRVRVMDAKSIDALILATDGFFAPYQSYANLRESCLKPLIRNTTQTHTTEWAAELVDRLAEKLGIGDDVSLSFFIQKNVKRKFY